MAEASEAIDLSLCAHYPGEQLRPVDQKLLEYAHGGAAQVFDHHAPNALRRNQRPDRENLTPALHTSAAVGAMILRAEADFPGAVQEFKARKHTIENVTTHRGGGIIRPMISTLGDKIEGAGSITGLYLATHAGDDNPDLSIWHTPPAITVAKRIQAMRHKGAARDFGPTGNGGEVWSGNSVPEECRGYVQAYLAREYHITATNVPAILAGGYAAVMLRSGALARAHANGDPIALRQVEDAVTAMKRAIAGRGESALISELNNPEFVRIYQLGVALLANADIQVRSWHGVADGISQARKAARSFFTTTTTRYARQRPTKVATEPKEFTDPMQTRSRIRPGTRTTGGPLPPRGDAAGADSTPPAAAGATGAEEIIRARMATSARAAAPEQRTFSPAASELVVRPFPVLIAARSLQTEIAQARRQGADYPHWAALFAATRLRSAGNNTTEEEIKYFAMNHNAIAKLAWQQMAKGDTFERLGRGEDLPPDQYAATLEVRRWLTAIANGRIRANGVTADTARTWAIRIANAQRRHIHRAYNVPDGEQMSPALFETLNELNLLRLAGAEVVEQPQQHQSFLRAVISRIVTAMHSIDPDTAVPAGSATTYWKRTRSAMHSRGPITADDLPPAARQQYLYLKRKAVGLFREDLLD